MAFERRLVVWGQADLIVFAFHLPALMETILIHAPRCHPAADPLRWKIHAFHIPISINLCNRLIKMGDYIFFVD